MPASRDTRDTLACKASAITQLTQGETETGFPSDDASTGSGGRNKDPQRGVLCFPGGYVGQGLDPLWLPVLTLYVISTSHYITPPSLSDNYSQPLLWCILKENIVTFHSHTFQYA